MSLKNHVSKYLKHLKLFKSSKLWFSFNFTDERKVIVTVPAGSTVIQIYFDIDDNPGYIIGECIIVMVLTLRVLNEKLSSLSGLIQQKTN